MKGGKGGAAQGERGGGGGARCTNETVVVCVVVGERCVPQSLRTMAGHFLCAAMRPLFPDVVSSTEKVHRKLCSCSSCLGRHPGSPVVVRPA